MKLMTKTIRTKLIRAHEKEIKCGDNYDINDQPVLVKFFHPGRYTFYAISGEEYGDDLIMFGYCLSPISPDFDEYGYVSLSELQSLPMMERDLYTKLGKLGEYVD